LHDLLAPLKRQGMSTTRFVSRPARTGHGDYFFYIDLQATPAEHHIAGAPTELQSMCAFYKLLGDYPVLPEYAET
jgi:chorismate mutase/prephenate dehydratase